MISIPEKYTVKSIEKTNCKEWLLKKHYAKRMAPIECCFGLFDSENILQGVCTFGTPASNPLRNLWQNEFKLMELNRLVVNEGLIRNVLSYFVGNSLKLIPKPTVIVSYADTEQNHHGYIYQATNWFYTGLSAKRTDWKIKGFEKMHGCTIADKSRGMKNRSEYLRETYGDDFYLEERSRKHRYFIFIGTHKQKKKMLRMLPYKLEEYPKGDNKRYNAEYNPAIQLNFF